MKRFHVHVAVRDLGRSIEFYSALFGAQPSVRKPDYAKWMIEDPRVNFAISQRGGSTGINHVGLQVDSDDELEALQQQVNAAEIVGVAQAGTACCYAQSNKYWLTDPDGIAWETYHTLGSIPVFGEAEAAAADGQTSASAQASATACCVPAPASSSCSTPAAKSGCCG